MSYSPVYDRLLRELFLQFTPCGTRQIYIAGDGSDSTGTGSESEPYRQINTALNSAQPGDLILVDDGTYAYTNPYGVNGTAQDWIAVMALPGANPQIDVNDTSGDDGLDIQQSSFLAFYGLEIFGDQESPSTNPSGIGIFRGSHHIRCWANLVHDFPGGGINCFWTASTTYDDSTLPAGSWDLLDISFNTIHGCCRYNPDNTSGLSFFAAIDYTGGATWDGTYAYMAIGNYIYDCQCLVPYTPGGFDYVTDGNGISVDSLWVPNNLDTGVSPYSKPGLIEGNLVIGCGGRGLHVYNSINVDDYFNTYVGNLLTDSPAITDGVETDAQYTPALDIANGVEHVGNVICPINTPNTTDGVSTYTDNVILGGTQTVPAGNTSRLSTGTAYFAGAPSAAELVTGLPVTEFQPVISDPEIRPAGTKGYQTTGAGGRPMTASTVTTPPQTAIPTIVQSCQYASSGESETITLTPATTPTAENLLVAVCVWKGGSSRAIQTPTGWTAIDSIDSNNNTDGLSTFYKVSTGTETSVTFSLGGTANDYCSGVLYEISGQASSPIDGHAIITTSTSGTSLASPSVTPTVDGCLAITAAGEDTNGGSPITITTGWTIDQNAEPGYHCLVAGHQTALTADTTTPITATITFGNGSQISSTTLLIAPGTIAGSSTTVQEWQAGALESASLPAVLV